MGSIDCDDNVGELCSMATDISNRDPAALYRELSPLQSSLRRIDLKIPVSGGNSRLLLSTSRLLLSSSRLLLSSSVDDPSYCLLLKIS